MYVVLFGATLLLVRAMWKDPVPVLRGGGKVWRYLFKGVAGVVVLRRSRWFCCIYCTKTRGGALTVTQHDVVVCLITKLI